MFANRIGSVGIVERQYAHFDEPLPLNSGNVLERFTLAYETCGTLNAERSNVIMIFHALSGDAHVAGYHTASADEKPGWWDEAVGPGKMFDTDRFYIICANVIGGCQGSTGPSSIAPDGRPYALRFPVITMQDMVRAHRRLLDHLGIKRLWAAVGGSMGGMQALQWAVDYPDCVDNLIFLASTPRSSTQQIAFNEVGRQAIYADPHWDNGNYYGFGHPIPAAGLSVARMVAHITYMSENSMQAKFGRQLQNGAGILPYRFDVPEFTVESYLKYQGEKFVNRFDANSYLYITKAIDYFDIAAGYGSLQAALERVQAHVLVATFSSDWLYAAWQSQEMVQALLNLGRPVEYQHLEAHFGHDSFLVETELMGYVVGGFLERRWTKRGAAPAEAASRSAAS
ncbi:MAG: homoserine O-acetyltransferase [Anaerolineae bacterium]|nr:homoserine O-acetyltransferase [Anaerolineae bacterium]